MREPFRFPWLLYTTTSPVVSITISSVHDVNIAELQYDHSVVDPGGVRWVRMNPPFCPGY